MAPTHQTIEIPVEGMDCAGCARSVQQALAALPGVVSVDVMLSSEKAILDVGDPTPDMTAIERAVERAGYRVPHSSGKVVPNDIDSVGRVAGTPVTNGRQTHGDAVSARMLRAFGVIFGAVLLVVVAGEVLGVFGYLSEHVPMPVGVLVVLAGGYPVFKQVVRSAFHGRVIAHTLMAVGAVAALIAGQWVTAAIVVFFMRMGDYAERFTTDQARESVRSLVRMAPEAARVIRGDDELTVPIEDVVPGDLIVVRPGEKIPVDGEVIGGHAVIDQSAITGESMPVDAGRGALVYAATIAQHGALRIRASAAGRDSTFGRVIRLVEEAERHKGPVQRYADRFSGLYLPVVAVIAGATYLLGGGLTATVAVLVVACSCAFALATPAAILASVGAAAKKGLLIKGGSIIESLARADVVLIDKTGTLTLGRPDIKEIVSLNGLTEGDLIRYVASAEKHSEHPLADAVRRLAGEHGVWPVEPAEFTAVPGRGVSAVVDGHRVVVGTADMAEAAGKHRKETPPGENRIESSPREHRIESSPGEHRIWNSADGHRFGGSPGTRLYVDIDGEAAGILTAADSEREEIPDVLSELRALGILNIELLTGDNETVAADLAGRLGIAYRAELLPEHKIEIVREYQRQGHTVVMIGDGVNDAPALAQADVGIAMAAGTDIAIEAAHLALMRDDWRLIPAAFRIARRTMGVVRLNIGFTALYNAVGLTLAAFGFLPPIYAAAAQSLPDVGIMANSARLIRQ